MAAKEKPISGIPRRVAPVKSTSSTTDVSENLPSIVTRSRAKTPISKPATKIAITRTNHLKPVNGRRDLSSELSEAATSKPIIRKNLAAELQEKRDNKVTNVNRTKVSNISKNLQTAATNSAQASEPHSSENAVVCGSSDTMDSSVSTDEIFTAAAPDLFKQPVAAPAVNHKPAIVTKSTATKAATVKSTVTESKSTTAASTKVRVASKEQPPASSSNSSGSSAGEASVPTVAAKGAVSAISVAAAASKKNSIAKNIKGVAVNIKPPSRLRSQTEAARNVTTERSTVASLSSSSLSTVSLQNDDITIIKERITSLEIDLAVKIDLLSAATEEKESLENIIKTSQERIKSLEMSMARHGIDPYTMRVIGLDESKVEADRLKMQEYTTDVNAKFKSIETNATDIISSLHDIKARCRVAMGERNSENIDSAATSQSYVPLQSSVLPRTEESVQMETEEINNTESISVPCREIDKLSIGSVISLKSCVEADSCTSSIATSYDSLAANTAT